MVTIAVMICYDKKQFGEEEFIWLMYLESQFIEGSQSRNSRQRSNLESGMKVDHRKNVASCLFVLACPVCFPIQSGDSLPRSGPQGTNPFHLQH